MALLKIISIIFATLVFAESKGYRNPKREVTNSLCDTIANTTNKIQCYCTTNNDKPEQIKFAECFLTEENVHSDDPAWKEFSTLHHIKKLIFTTTKGILIKYVPTTAIKEAKALSKLVIRYGNIERIHAFAFANSTQLEEITLRDNNIKILEKHAFAHLHAVSSISLDTNDIEEINRDVFIDLPMLEKLYLTGNKISTIHDRAFIHLNNLRELEIDKNKLISLNSETLSGLHKLRRLELSSNNLEVIGANTFIHLRELYSLNLDGNQIQMLDEKAFNGLKTLQTLSLAYNKLTEINNPKIFEGLTNLKTMSLKDNKIDKFKSDVIQPILRNFYGSTSFLNFEGNNFPCDCNIDWFLTIKNNTNNNLLKNSLTNVRCHPSDSLREAWKKVAETEAKTENENFEDDDQPNQNLEYEYYDETQLNGTLFYTDIRFLLNCTSEFPTHGIKATAKPISITKATSSPTSISTTGKPIPNKPGINQGLLDLSDVETTTQVHKSQKTTDNVIKVELTSEKNANDKKLNPTTTRLATVSAKPINKGYNDQDMASDEAKPDRIKAHRSYQEETKDPNVKINNAQRNIGCIPMLSIIIMLSLRSFL